MYGTPLRRNGANPYRSVSVDTASPRARLLMLFDGAVRFALGGARCIEQGDVAGKGEKLVRAQAIVHELQAVLDHDVAPDLCATLSALYGYVAELLVKANLDGDTAAVEEAVELLRTVRSGFAEADSAPAEAPEEEPPAEAASGAAG